MKKLFLFIGVIMSCLHFSCKKNSNTTPPPPIDSFLLHPPPVLDSLSIPFTIGTWWKYQRIDSSLNFTNPVLGPDKKYIDSSIELIKVIGKTSFAISVEGYINYTPRWRYDTVESFMLEVKNLTKGTLDTIHAFYYNSSFFIEPHIDAFRLYIKVPIIEGAYLNTNPNYPYQKTNAIKNLSVSILNKIFDNCIYFEDLSESGGSEYIVHQIKTYIQPGLGIVDWEYYDLWASHYGYGDKGWYYRRLIDFHIAP